MTEDGQHYFTARPAAPLSLRDLVVTLAGQERRLKTAGGIFSPDRIDAGTQVLLSNVPSPPSEGHILDLGCGWGPLALTLGLTSPGAAVWAVDVNERALELVRTNAELLHLDALNAVLPDDVPDSLEFSAIWSNPPIRVGKDELHAMLRRWLPRLAAGADAWLVVQKNLGSDSLQRWMAEEFDFLRIGRAANSRGYRVLHAHRVR